LIGLNSLEAGRQGRWDAKKMEVEKIGRWAGSNKTALPQKAGKLVLFIRQDLQD